MNRSRVTGNLASHGNIFVDIANDRVGIGSTIPTHKIDVSGTVKLHDHTGYQNHITYNPSGPAPHLHFPTGPLANLARTPYIGFGDRTSGGDFKIYHDYYNAHLKLSGLGGLFLSNNTGNIGINGANGSGGVRTSFYIPAGANEGIKLYHGHPGSLKFETVGYGVTVHGTTETQELNVTGVTTTSGDVTVGSGGENSALGVRFNSAYAQIKLPDGQTGANRKGNLSFGDNDDFRIVHDGHHNYITAGTGSIFVSTSSANPVNIYNSKVDVNVDLNLIDTATDSAAGPEFKLFRNSASPADNDYLGQIKFAGESDTGVERDYAKITGKILDASNGTEDGIIEFAHIKAGSQVITGRWRSDSLQLLNSTNLSVDGTTTHNDHVSIAADNKQLKIGASSDFILYHDGTSTIMTNNMAGTSGNLVIQPKSGENGIKVIPDGAVELYYDNSLKLSTGNNGINVSGSVSLSDSNRIYLGSSNDLELYHDGSNSHIKNATGTLIFRSDNYQFIDKDNGDVMMKLLHDGAVELYHNNVKKLETAADRINAYGHIFILDGNLYIRNGFNDANVRIRNTGGSNDANFEFLVRDSGTELEAVEITKDGNLRIPNDNRTLQIGAGNDLQIYHDGTSSYVSNTTGNLYIEAKAGETAIQIIPDGAVDLRHNGSKKIETTSTGAAITGKLSLSDDDPTLNLIDTNNNNFAIKANTGILYITDATANQTRATMTASGVWTLNNDASVIHSGGGGTAYDVLTLGGSTSGNNTFPRIRFRTTSNTNTLGRIGIFDAGATDSFSGDFVVELNPGTNGDSTQEKFRVTSDGAAVVSGNRNQVAPSNYDDLTGANQAAVIVGSSGITDAGIMLRTSSTGRGRIYFGDNSGSDAGRKQGQIVYYNDGDYMSFVANGSERFRITSDGSSYFGPQIITEADMNWGHDAHQRPFVFSGNQAGANPADASIVVANPNTDPSSTRMGSFMFGCKTSSGGNSGIKAYIEGWTTANPSNAYEAGGYMKFVTRQSEGNLLERLRLTDSDGIKIYNYPSGNIINYGGGSANQTNAAINMFRGGNQYCNISIGSNYGCGLYISGANSTQTDMLVLQQDNSKNAYLSNRSTNPIYFQTGSSNTTRVAIRHSGSAMVDIYGEAAYNNASSGARGIDVSYSGSSSVPIYFGTEHNTAQKGMYMSGYWMYIRGHQNEGIRFVFSQGHPNAPRSDQYQFKYNSATRPGGTTWDGFSDVRAKENVVSITNGIDTIKKLRPVTYDWTNDYADSQTMYIMGRDEDGGTVAKKENGYDTDRKNGQYGFIAQEYETVFPKDIRQDKFTLGDTEIPDFKTLNHDSLIPTLTAALKEAVAKIEVLEAKVAALEGS